MMVDGQQMTVTLRKQGMELVASVMPSVSGVKDKAVERITPLCMTGTPEDFDESFIEKLKEGLPDAVGLVSNIKEYEDGLEAAKKNSEMAKKAKDEKDKAKKEFDGYIELARQNLREEKFVDAKKCLDKAAAVKDADKALIDKARKAIDERSGAGSLFGGPIDKSDGKNVVWKPGMKSTTADPTPQPAAQPSSSEPKPADANDAFEQAMALADDETDNDDENENMEE